MSNQFIKMDNREFEQMFKWYEAIGPKKLIPAVTRGYLNDLAFETKDQSAGTMKAVFDHRSSATHKYLFTAVNVQKAKLNQNVAQMMAEVGIRSGGEDQPRTYKREIMTRQEIGGEVKQVKRTGGFRSMLVMPKKKQYSKKRQLFGKSGVMQMDASIKNPKQKMAESIAMARENNYRYAATPYGLYRVKKEFAEPVRYWIDQGDRKTAPKPWLFPASKIAIDRREKIFKRNLDRQIKKFKLK